MTRGRHGLHAVLENGPPPRSFAADAHDCIMVRIRTGSTEYKGVARCSAPDGELPSDHHPEAWVTPRHNRQEWPVDMWTIGGADRLRFPASRASSKSGEMLAFAHIPTGPTNQKN